MSRDAFTRPLVDERPAAIEPPASVFLLDLWCIVPYYTGYLCRALLDQGMNVKLGSISYHFDVTHFTRNGLQNDPGLLDVVGKLKIRPALLRRLLKATESCINMAALALRFLGSRPDILHVQYIPLVELGLPFEPWLLKYAKRLGTKLVYTVHNELPLDSGERHKKSFSRIYRMMDALICHTHEAKERIAREYSVEPERIYVIPHGPMFHDASRPTKEQSRARLGVPQEECVVLWQGWIKPYKGLQFLLESWRKVHGLKLRARLIVAGSGDRALLDEIEHTVRVNGLEESVQLDFRFVPAQELPLLYQAADIIVYPYREITTSGALMTGVSYGKAIVASDLSAFREVLHDRENAILVPYGDTDQLAQTLTELILDPAHRQRLAAAASVLAERLDDSWTTIAQSTLRCYEAVLINGQ